MSRASIVSLVNTAFLIVLIVLAQRHLLFVNLQWSYQTHKFLHLLGVCMFVGNVFVGPIWLFKALQTQNKEVIKYAFGLLLLTDMLVTIPGIDLTVINGLYLSSAFGGSNSQDWLIHSILGLFALWVFVFPLLLLQDKMHKLAQKEETQNPLFKKLIFTWIGIGALSMIPVSYIFYAMVFKNY